MNVKARTLSDLNRYIVKTKPNWVAGVLSASNMANEFPVSNNGFLIGDCILAKLNLIKQRQMRKLRMTKEMRKIVPTINQILDIIARELKKCLPLE